MMMWIGRFGYPPESAPNDGELRVTANVVAMIHQRHVRMFTFCYGWREDHPLRMASMASTSPGSSQGTSTG